MKNNNGLAKDINKELKNLYKTFLDSLYQRYDAKEYNYPLLMKCTSSYCGSGTRMLFVTNESKNWLSDKECYTSLPGNRVGFDIDMLMDLYDNYNCKFAKGDKGSKPFERAMLSINNSVNPEFDCLWTSYWKVGRKDGRYPQRDEYHYCEDENASILLREIDYTKPDVVVFATGTGNNNDIHFIKSVLGNSALFVPVKENSQISLVTDSEMGRLVVRIPSSPVNSKSMYQVLTALIQENVYAY